MIFSAITPRRFMMAIETGMGGPSPQRVLRANIREIERLRRSPLSGPRPAEIKSIAIIDDEAPIVRITQRIIGKRLSQMNLSYKNLSALDLEKLSPMDDTHFILAMDSVEDIRRMPELITTFKIDLTITDHDMLGFRGSELIRQARELGHQGFMIGMTGLPQNMDLFYQSGADLAINKPFEQETILNLFTG